MVTHSSILAWRIPRTEESGELQSVGSQSLIWLSAYAHWCTSITKLICYKMVNHVTLQLILTPWKSRGHRKDRSLFPFKVQFKRILTSSSTRPAGWALSNLQPTWGPRFLSSCCSAVPHMRAQSLGCVCSLRPHGHGPTWVLCPWNFPGKNTGVSYHFLLHTGVGWAPNAVWLVSF